MQKGSAGPLAGWTRSQDSLAASTGLSILLVEGRQPPSLATSNNNSICHAFQSSPDHVHLCDPYCGVAYERAVKANGPVHYRCHAGLNCVTLPVRLHKKRELAVIGGRAFLTAADYRALAERFRAGDLRELLSAELFKNVIFAAREDLDELAARVPKEAKAFSASAHEEEPEAIELASLPAKTEQFFEPAGAGGGSLKGFDQRIFISAASLDDACETALRLISEKNDLESVALLLREEDKFACASTTGQFRKKTLNIPLQMNDPRLVQAVKSLSPLVVYETAGGFVPLSTGRQKKGGMLAELFPLSIGDEIKGALMVADEHLSNETRASIFLFCRDVAFPLEVIRLREELEKSTSMAFRLKSFTDTINDMEPSATYHSILQHSTELLRAERGSLLVFDEVSKELTVKAAVGTRADVLSDARVRLGEGVSGMVFQEGRPLVVRDISVAGVVAAPAERLYKTKSFISYPITIGGRKVGLLNVTDKTGEGCYDEIDLSLLESIAPQMALALDRAEWQEKAAQFQLMSITDPLTGLLNRRYLEERLTEELNRSRRYEYSMSFMMIDIDDFKHYNDRNGHQAGDLALEMTAQCLKSALRSADIASRYGGEEFCILLPQTSLSEAKIIAERIRRRVERTRYPHGKQQPLGAVTVSLGICAFAPELETPETIIGGADRALYFAKHSGKNRVEAYEETPPETTP